MPTVVKHGDDRFFFFSNEGNEPMHIHIESGDSYAKFRLEPDVHLAKSIGFNAKELNDIREFIIKNADLFKEKWHEHFSG